MIREWDLNFCPVRDQGSGGFKPKEWFFGQRLARFARMVGIVQADRDNFGGTDRRQSAQAFEASRLLVKGRGTKDIAMQAKQFAIDYFSEKNLVALLKSPDCCHKCGRISSNCPLPSQDESSQMLQPFCRQSI